MSDHEPATGRRARLARARPWVGPVVGLVLALIAFVILFGKLRRDVWTYYTDPDGETVNIEKDKARPVLWQDPEEEYFEADEKADQLDAAFSADGTAMILVRKSDAGSDLYLARWDGRIWSQPQPIESINTDANERGPALSRDGRYLYFASDRKGSKGGYDLYSARWKDGQWSNVQALPDAVNGASNELAPALSADGAQLYFTSDRDGKGAEDIFVSNITTGENKAPVYAEAEPVDGLNSKAADVQAAMTERGDHVFLASDRDRTKEAGFKVYLSRVVDGEALPPEEVDLYVEKGDVTDPAVRMEGFDLLFSSDKEVAGSSEDGPDFRLFRSTTREVITFTDLSRWEQFKELMGNIAWWILLAIAALIALIYLLEKWRDITSLFHKCLAGSAALHLIALLIAMFLLIAREITENTPPEYEDVVVNIDALAEEELAMESVPEETVMTDTTTDLQSEKMESEFGAPGFEAQDQQAVEVEVAAQTPREAVEVEVQPVTSDAVEMPQPPQETSVLNELAAAALPEVDTPLLEERDPTEPQPAADTSLDEFTPAEPEQIAATAKVEPTMQENPVENTLTANEVTELHVQEPLVDSPKESAVETAAAESESAEEQPTEQPVLDPAAISDLPAMAFSDPAETALEEPDPADSAAADTSQDTFNPDASATEFAAAQAQGETIADAAMSDAADAGAVSETGAVTGASAVDTAISQVGTAPSAADSTLPPAELLAGTPGGGLPELALEDMGTPTLEEPAAQGAEAAPPNDSFEPSQPAAGVATSRAESSHVADTAMASESPAPSVATARTAAPAADATPPTFISAIPNNAMPPSPLDPSPVGALPETALIDTGAPMLEEPGKPAATAPADTTVDQFKPAGGALPNVATNKAEGKATPDTAASGQSDAAAVATAARVSNPANVESRPPESSGTPTPNTVPPLNPGSAKLSALPDVAIGDPGAPMLEEPGKPGGAPADTSADLFKPNGGAISSLVTAKTGGSAVADSALTDPSNSTAVGKASRDPGAADTTAARAIPEAAGGLPELAVGMAPTDLSNPAALAAPGLPGELEAPNSDPNSLAKLIQKQRGKPGIDTIKQMGGSDGTEGAIGAAMEWLSKNQEADGRWDSRKHGAKTNHDLGGTGLALLCFYGWGERHDKACKYQNNVRRGLEWLLSKQGDDGYLGGGAGMMYSHAIATIALCEAYGVTKDAKLKEPAERAIEYTLKSQSPTRGGWRYSPGQDSDTSVTGWQYMAMHSARMAGLQVPDENFERVRRFLGQMGGGKHGGLYGYQERGKLSRAMVATGMFCRQLDLVPPSHPMQSESARLLKMHPMKTSKPDLYYVYYATLALYQHQGPVWASWNEKLKETLPLIQKKTGGAAGSWDPSSSMTSEGGRVVSTALSTLSLEVYYRLLPMYGFRNEEAEAPEKKEREEQ